ncbi:MAG: hypothetical protein QM831_00795 [Kofleriaceae bacterium]
MNDQERLADIAKGLTHVDMDPDHAIRIRDRVRHDLGKGPPKVRFVMPIVVGLLSTITFVWAIYKVWQSLR